MTTRRPLRPIKEKSILYREPKQSLWEKLNTNGDLSNMILQLAMAPFVFPYIWIQRLRGKR